MLEEHTVQINITRLYNIQKQRKKNYYLLYRQQDERIFSVCLINSSFKLKNKKIPLLLPHTVNYSILPPRYI